MIPRVLQTLLLASSLVFTLNNSQAATLRLSGSNTVGADLGPALAVAWLESIGYGDIKVDRKGEGTDIRAQAPDGETMEVSIEAKGSSSGFRGLSCKRCSTVRARRSAEIPVPDMAPGRKTRPANNSNPMVKTARPRRKRRSCAVTRPRSRLQRRNQFMRWDME